MKRIKLDYHQEVTISDEAFEQIKAVVRLGMVCSRCQRAYTNDVPCVALNTCLTCYLKRDGKSLTYTGVLSTSDSGDVTHMFMDSEGFLYLTATSTTADAHRSQYHTLTYWGFPIPASLQRDGQTVELSTWEWHIYGDVKTNSVLYIEWDKRYGNAKPIGFLTTRNGEFVEVNKRKKYYQELFKEARAKLEATKDAHGEYHIGDKTVYGLYAWYINDMVSHLASAEHDQSKNG